jgi:uncharacterized protein YbcI
MKTQGEIEASICQGMSRFELEYMGRGPNDIHTYLIDDLVVVGLQGVLTAAEQHLVKSLPTEKGRDLLKQVRTHLLETARAIMEAMVEKSTGTQVLSMHQDISTVTGEEVVLFTLAGELQFREVKRKPNIWSNKQGRSIRGFDSMLDRPHAMKCCSSISLMPSVFARACSYKEILCAGD